MGVTRSELQGSKETFQALVIFLSSFFFRVLYYGLYLIEVRLKYFGEYNDTRVSHPLT